MAKRAVSVTLGVENITWLRGRAGSSGARSLSDLLDQLVTAARTSGRIGGTRSVAGTIDINPEDPLLEHADEHLRALYEASLGQPLLARETRARIGRPVRASKRRRRG